MDPIVSKWNIGCCGIDELQIAPLDETAQIITAQLRQKKIQFPINSDHTKYFTHIEMLEIGALLLCCSSLRKKYTQEMNNIAWCIASQDICPPPEVAVYMLQQLLNVWYAECLKTPLCVPPATIDMLNDIHLQKFLRNP